MAKSEFGFYGQFRNPQIDEYLLQRFFPNTLNGFFIEAGAHDGIDDSNCKYFEEVCGWTGINIEPDPDVFRVLTQNRPQSTNIHCGLTTPMLSGTEQLFTSVGWDAKSKTGLGSFHFREPDNPSAFVFDKIMVPVLSYSAIVAQYGVQRVDLLSLDIEGGELDVLTGLGVVFPTVCCIEFPRVGLQPLTELMGGKGYRLDSTIHNCACFFQG